MARSSAASTVSLATAITCAPGTASATGQASRSQFRAYDAHGGLVSRGADLTWSLPINDQWNVSTVLAVQYLAKEAADSPIVERRMQTSLAGQVVYSF